MRRNDDRWNDLDIRAVWFLVGIGFTAFTIAYLAAHGIRWP